MASHSLFLNSANLREGDCVRGSASVSMCTHTHTPTPAHPVYAAVRIQCSVNNVKWISWFLRVSLSRNILKGDWPSSWRLKRPSLLPTSPFQHPHSGAGCAMDSSFAFYIQHCNTLSSVFVSTVTSAGRSAAILLIQLHEIWRKKKIRRHSSWLPISLDIWPCLTDIIFPSSII